MDKKRYCPKCGKEITDTMKYCPKCGYHILYEKMISNRYSSIKKEQDALKRKIRKRSTIRLSTLFLLYLLSF